MGERAEVKERKRTSTREMITDEFMVWGGERAKESEGVGKGDKRCQKVTPFLFVSYRFW